MLSVRLRTKWFWVRVQLQSLNHSNADKKVFVVLPDCQSYFSFLYLYEKKNSEIDATQQKQRKQLILTDSKNIFT